MTDFARTPDANFENLKDFPFEPHWHTWEDLRVHYVDEGPRDGPVMLLTHGMPTWSYLYRDIIPSMVDAGYRCIAPDHLGFGRSDKPTDIHWYTIARHTEVLSSLITALDLQHITLLCQDWGGPTGLAQAAMMPERFDRLTIMNTWLHHDGYEYSDAIRNWNQNWHEGGIFAREKPDLGLLMAMTAGLLSREETFPHLIGGTLPEFSSEAAKAMHDAYLAPFRDLGDDAYHGARRFPLSIPLQDPNSGNAVAQACHYRLLLEWNKPLHFIWGGTDDVFTEAWGREWSARFSRVPGGVTFDLIADAGHFLQNTHGTEVARILLARIEQEA